MLAEFFLCGRIKEWLIYINEVEDNECRRLHVIKILLISVIPMNDLKQNIKY